MSRVLPRRSRLFRFVVPAVLGLVLAVPLAAAAGGVRPRFEPDDAEKLAADLAALVAKHHIPGAAVALVSTDGILWSGGFGAVPPEAGGSITPDTPFRVGSISKSLIALAVLRLVEAGRLDLQTPVSALLPEMEIPNPWNDTDPVRLVHLLEHTAGLEDQHFHDVYNLDDAPDMPLEDVLALNPRARRVRWRPGTRVAYSNIGYTLVGCILERVTSQPFEQVLADSVLAPLGMNTSTFRVTGDIQRALAPGHLGPGEPAPFRHLYQRPASALASTAADLSRLVQLLLNRGRLGDGIFLSEASIERMETPYSSALARAGFDLGYGLGNRPGVRNGVVYHGHGGGLPEYSAIYAYVPETGRGCVVLTSTGAGGLNALFGRVFQEVAAAGSVAPPIALDRSRLADLTGYYEYRNPERRLDAPVNILLAGTTITLEGDTLYQSGLGSDPAPLVPVSPTTFRRPGEPVASLVFAADDEGRLWLGEPMARAEYARTASWRPLVHRGLLLAALVLMLTTIAYALAWIPAGILRRLRHVRPAVPALRLKLIPLLTVTVFAACLVMLFFWGSHPQQAGEPSPPAVGFFLFTLLFAALSLVSFTLAAAALRRPESRPAALYALLVSVACVGLTATLWYWDIIGLRLWAY